MKVFVILFLFCCCCFSSISSSFFFLFFFSRQHRQVRGPQIQLRVVVLFLKIPQRHRHKREGGREGGTGECNSLAKSADSCNCAISLRVFYFPWPRRRGVNGTAQRAVFFPVLSTFFYYYYYVAHVCTACLCLVVQRSCAMTSITRSLSLSLSLSFLPSALRCVCVCVYLIAWVTHTWKHKATWNNVIGLHHLPSLRIATHRPRLLTWLFSFSLAKSKDTMMQLDANIRKHRQESSAGICHCVVFTWFILSWLIWSHDQTSYKKSPRRRHLPTVDDYNIFLVVVRFSLFLIPRQHSTGLCTFRWGGNGRKEQQQQQNIDTWRYKGNAALAKLIFF